MRAKNNTVKTLIVAGRLIYKTFYGSIGVMRSLLLISILTLSPLAISAIGEYVVPVSESDLEPYSKFDVEYTVFQNEDFQKLSYTLPKEFSAIELNSVSFIGKVKEGKNLRLSGTFGEVKCETPRIEFKSNCEVKYNEAYKKYLDLLKDAVEKEMRRTIEDPDLLQARKRVWNHFREDPLGRIHFKEVSY